MAIPLPRMSAAIAAALGCFAIAAAAAADVHRPAVSQSGGGSGGAAAFVQTSSTGGALQGEVAANPNAKIAYPFGVLGEYDASSSTFGIGVLGISTTGYAVGGQSLSASQPSILGYAANGGIGIEAVVPDTASGSPAIYAENKGNGDGISSMLDQNASSAQAAAISGIDASNNHSNEGLYGQSSAGVGVFGNALGSGDAIYGQSNSGHGVEGYSTNESGVLGRSSNMATPGPSGPFAFDEAGITGTSYGGPAGYFSSNGSGDGVDVITSGVLGEQISANGTYGTGIRVFGQDVGLSTYSQANFGFPMEAVVATGQSFGVVASTNGTGTTYPLYLEGNGNTVAYIDDSGALYLHNGVHNFISTRDGASVESYTPHASSPTIEDVGEDRLVNGRAVVRIADAMQATLDRRVAYHVFLTPEADTDGLYLAQKAPGYFVVREMHGGHGTLTFEYRVVGTLDGQAGSRMAVSSRRRLSDGIAAPHVSPSVMPLRRYEPRAVASLSRKRKPFIAPAIRAPFASAARQ